MFKLAVWVGAVYAFPTPPVAFGSVLVVHREDVFIVCILGFGFVLPLFVGHVPDKAFGGFGGVGHKE